MSQEPPAAQTASKGTRYIILREPENVVAIVTATSSDAALREAVKREAITESGTYVATPERSFTARKVTVEQTTSVKLG